MLRAVYHLDLPLVGPVGLVRCSVEASGDYVAGLIYQNRNFYNVAALAIPYHKPVNMPQRKFGRGLPLEFNYGIPTVEPFTIRREQWLRS